MSTTNSWSIHVDAVNEDAEKEIGKPHLIRMHLAASTGLLLLDALADLESGLASRSGCHGA